MGGGQLTEYTKNEPLGLWSSFKTNYKSSGESLNLYKPFSSFGKNNSEIGRNRIAHLQLDIRQYSGKTGRLAARPTFRPFSQPSSLQAFPALGPGRLQVVENSNFKGWT